MRQSLRQVEALEREIPELDKEDMRVVDSILKAIALLEGLGIVDLRLVRLYCTSYVCHSSFWTSSLSGMFCL